jgi:hypothetical protein
MYEMDNVAQNAKVYRVKWWRRASAILFVVLGILFLTAFCWGPISGQADPKPLGIVFSAAFTLVGILWTIGAFKSTVTLSNDAIEVRGIWGCKRLPLNGIRGRREYVVRGGGVEEGSTRYLKLVPDDDRLSPLEFEKYFTFDDAFYQWFNKLPDLDAMDKMKHKDSGFGLV